MRAILTEPFVESLIKAPPEIQKLFGKQFANLLRNLRHHSLRAGKYDDERWYARINGGWRFFFRIEKDSYFERSEKQGSRSGSYILLDIFKHPK